MANERAKYFRSSTEVRASRPAFDEHCLVSLESFASLVGAYAFADTDEVCCQLVIDGSRCNQPHKNGWIAKRKDGAEGYIGRQCARRRFNADVSFAAEARRVELEIEVDRLIDRLSALLSDNSLPDALTDARERVAVLRSGLRSIRDDIHPDVWKRLDEMRKTGNRVVPIEVRYIEKDERGKERHTWVADSLGSVSGIDAFDVDRVRAVVEQIDAAFHAIEHARPSRAEARQTLRQWVESLEAGARVAVEVGDLESEFERFLRPENLRLLAYLTRKHDVRIQLTGMAIGKSEQASREGLSPSIALKAWDDEIRRARGGRDFRPA